MWAKVPEIQNIKPQQKAEPILTRMKHLNIHMQIEVFNKMILTHKFRVNDN